MTKEQIKSAMLNMGVSEDQINKLTTKEQYQEAYNMLMDLNNLSENTEAEIVEDTSSAEEMPKIYSPEWTEYVLSKMSDDEKRDGHPTVDGLRRVVDELFHIHAVKSKVYESPSNINGYHATVRVTVITEAETMDACADAGLYNTEAKYGRHSVATAESRAEARAYRKILRLRNIISAEEVVNELEIGDPTERIQEAQLNAIDNMCKKNDINLGAWLKSKDIDIENLKKISRSLGTELCASLNALQTIGVEDIYLGYVNWR